MILGRIKRSITVKVMLILSLVVSTLLGINLEVSTHYEYISDLPIDLILRITILVLLDSAIFTGIEVIIGRMK